MLDKTGGPIEYTSITIDVLCVAKGSPGEHEGISGVRLLVYGLEKESQKDKIAEPQGSMIAGPAERLVIDFPLPGYTAVSSRMADEGFYFQRSDGTQYFGTHEFATGAAEVLLPKELECQSIWARAKGVKDFSLEVSKCTFSGELAGLQVFGVLDFGEGASSADLSEVLRGFLARIQLRRL